MREVSRFVLVKAMHTGRGAEEHAVYKAPIALTSGPDLTS